jgi:hypothetical protein
VSGRGIGLIGFIALLAFARPLVTPSLAAEPEPAAQHQPPSQILHLTSRAASTWRDGAISIVQLDGPVAIELERATLSAQRAVVWLTEARGGQEGEQSVVVALMGDAKVVQPGITRSGGELLVNARVNGPIQITADMRSTSDLSASPTYQQAIRLRQQVELAPATRPVVVPSAATTRTGTAAPGTMLYQPAPVYFRSPDSTSVNVEGRLAFVCSRGVAITTQDPGGQFIQMQAERAVVFTLLTNLRDIGGPNAPKSIEESITSAYLEGDVRVSILPSDPLQPEQRLQAERVYYDFPTQRAVLTDAIIHTVDVQRGIPIVVRAKTVKQLSDGEFRVRNSEITTSGFAVPSYSIRADKAYVRSEPSGDERYGNRVTFVGENITFNAFHLPFFYLPVVGGQFTERGFPLRGISFGDSTKYGPYIESEWGFFETLGRIPPRNFDLSFHADYYGDRGPGTGFDGRYGGGFISPSSRQAYNFEGEFETYFVWDNGTDILGRRRGEIPVDEDFRGMVDWRQQTFLPDDWQLQLRAGWVSDATFREEWFEDDFNNGLPLETSLYLKRQHDTEAITFLASVQANNVVTTSDLVQEQFEIERVPQIGYHRIGDSLWNDKLTFYSNNTVERVRFNVSGANLGEQGYRFGADVRPGRPSLGLMGETGLGGPPPVDEDFTNRGDFRQEIAYPVALGRVKAMPYVVGRFTSYSETPDSGRADRAFAGTGVRFNTQFWRIDNSAESKLFDVHRVRHIIEPEVHLWTGVENIDPSELWIYDEPVDRVYDYSAAQVALRQRWQTKRGGPGRWRSVDFFTLDIEANFFSNQPSDVELAPLGFRGMFYPSMPEVAIPRNSLNADAKWRISDTTILISDVQHNLDERRLATASVGMIAQRSPRTSYYLGLRYIDELDSSIGTAAIGYQLTAKYSIALRESIDFNDGSNVYSWVTFTRKFDRFFMLFTVFNNADSGESGFSIGIYPEGLAAGISSDQLANTSRRR